MKVSLSSSRQNCCLIGHSSFTDKDSCALCCLLIMFFLFCCLCSSLGLRVYVGGDIDKMTYHKVIHSDDISLSMLTWLMEYLMCGLYKLIAIWKIVTSNTRGVNKHQYNNSITATLTNLHFYSSDLTHLSTVFLLLYYILYITFNSGF